MEETSFKVPGISCNHCVNTIKRELGELPGVVRVEGDAASKTITVAYDAPATLEGIRATLKEINYPPAE